MHYFFVDRNAQSTGESVEALESRYATRFSDISFGNLVQLHGAYARFDSRLDGLVGFSVNFSR
jgi:hypothetical protein